MIYLATANSPAIRQHMADGKLGMITTPRDGRSPVNVKVWGADNGCFGKGYPGDDAWLAWLSGMDPAGCLFAVAPDVVGDAAATWARSAPTLPRIRAQSLAAE